MLLLELFDYFLIDGLLFLGVEEGTLDFFHIDIVLLFDNEKIVLFLAVFF